MNPYYNESAFLQDLAILVNTDSGTGTVEGIDKIANFMMKKYADLGMWTEKKTFRADLGPCVEARNHPKSKEIDLLLIGHMDTVFPVGTAAERPLTVDGNRVLGPGAADMKSGTLLCTCLAAFVQAERPELKLCIAHNCDEEIGSPSSDAWIRGLASHATYCFDLEPGRSDGSYVKTRKGVCRLSIKLHGKSAHAGVNPDDGASAVVELAKWICRFARPCAQG